MIRRDYRSEPRLSSSTVVPDTRRLRNTSLLSGTKLIIHLLNYSKKINSVANAYIRTDRNKYKKSPTPTHHIYVYINQATTWFSTSFAYLETGTGQTLKETQQGLCEADERV